MSPLGLGLIIGFVFGLCFCVAALAAVYHISKAQGVHEGELFQGFTQLAFAGIFLVGFIIVGYVLWHNKSMT